MENFVNARDCLTIFSCVLRTCGPYFNLVSIVTVQPGCGIDYLLGSYALENIKDTERKQAKGALSESLYR